MTMLYYKPTIVLVSAAWLLLVLATSELSCDEPTSTPASGLKKWTIEELLNGSVRIVKSIHQIEALRGQPGADDPRLIAPLQVSKLMLEESQCVSGMGRTFMYMLDNSLKINAKIEMPRALEVFIRGLGYEISANCKVNLIEQCAKLDNSLLSQQELEPVLKLERAGAFLLDEETSKSLKKTDIIRVTNVLLNLLEENAWLDKSLKLTLTGSGRFFMASFKSSCNAIYNNIDKALFTTVLMLANFGFDYSMRSELTKEHRDRLNQSADVRRWLNVLMLCRSMGDLEQFKDGVRPLEPRDLQLTSPKAHDLAPFDWDDTVRAFGKMTAEEEVETQAVAEKLYRRVAQKVGGIMEKLKPRRDRNFRVGFLQFVDSKIGPMS